MITPTVITSKVADKDFEKIQSNHASILEGMSNQAIKSENYRAQKATELQAQQTQKTEMQKAKMTADTQTQKNAMDFQQKQSEIDIKRASLNSQ